MLEDLRYAARMLLKHPGFTLVAVLSLGVGIGATTTVFGLLNATLLRPLPVQDPETLVSVNKPYPDASRIHTISYPDYLDYGERADIFSDIIAWTETDVVVDLDGQAEQTWAVLVSGNYFPVLGPRPALGRLFTGEVDRAPGAAPVMVLSYTFWQRRFAGDSTIIGRTLALNGQPLTVVGVAPQGFTSTYNMFAPAFYVPLTMQEQLRSRPDILRTRGWKNLKLTARLAPGVTQGQAESALSLLDRQLEQAWAPQGPTSNRANLGVELVPVGAYPGDILLGLFGGAALLMAIVGCVLLIACANVAGMLLARATARQREIAVRLAVGATRGRLVRQLLVESGLLFLVAGALGLGLTVWLTRLLMVIPIPLALPVALDARVDWRVLGFTLALALLTGVVFGLAPALEAARTSLHRAASGVRRSRLRHAFVVGQIALSLMLLVGAGLFARALEYGRTIYPGTRPETVLTARLEPEVLGYDVARARELYRRLAERAAALPGVAAVGMAREVPVGMGYSVTNLAVEDAPEMGDLETEANTVGPGYFTTLGIRLLAGREFTPADRDGAPLVAIINQAMTRRFWPGTSPLGRRIQVGDDRWAEIVGVVEDGRHRLAGHAPPPFAYRPFLQSRSDNTAMTLLLRYRGDQAGLVAALRREIRALDARLPLLSPASLSASVELTTLPWRIAGMLARAFGVIGLALAAMGIYGLVSWTVSQRTREIGVRVALGADARAIGALVIGHGMKLALLGVGIGVTLSFGATQALGAFLFGISPSDPGRTWPHRPCWPRWCSPRATSPLGGLSPRIRWWRCGTSKFLTPCPPLHTGEGERGRPYLAVN